MVSTSVSVSQFLIGAPSLVSLNQGLSHVRYNKPFLLSSCIWSVFFFYFLITATETKVGQSYLIKYSNLIFDNFWQFSNKIKSQMMYFSPKVAPAKLQIVCFFTFKGHCTKIILFPIVRAVWRSIQIFRDVKFFLVIMYIGKRVFS